VHTAPHAGTPSGQGTQPAACALFAAPLLDFVEFRLHKILHQAHWPQAFKRNIGLLPFDDMGTGKSFAAGCIANALPCKNSFPVYKMKGTLALARLLYQKQKRLFLARSHGIQLFSYGFSYDFPTKQEALQ
jgi:hypothetical protein